MKNINLKVIIFLLFSQVVLSQSAPEYNPENTIESIERIETLSHSLLESDDIESREAFRLKSKAKVDDLYNYLNIIGNPDFEEGIRTHTISLVKKMFAKEATISNILSSEKTISTHSFLDKVLSSKEKIKFSMTNVSLKSNIITYSLKLNQGNNLVKSMNISQAIYWENKEKMFGNTSKKVLTSSLGSITIDKP